MKLLDRIVLLNEAGEPIHRAGSEGPGAGRSGEIDGGADHRARAQETSSDFGQEIFETVAERYAEARVELAEKCQSELLFAPKPPACKINDCDLSDSASFK